MTPNILKKATLAGLLTAAFTSSTATAAPQDLAPAGAGEMAISCAPQAGGAHVIGNGGCALDPRPRTGSSVFTTAASVSGWCVAGGRTPGWWHLTVIDPGGPSDGSSGYIRADYVDSVGYAAPCPI